MTKKIFYVARGNLNERGTAEYIHSVEDVRGLISHGWDALLLTSSDTMLNIGIPVPIQVITKKSYPLERILFELIVGWKVICNRPDFVLIRGATNLALVCFVTKAMRIPYGVELNGVLGYRYEKRWSMRHAIERLFDKFIMKNSSVIIGVTEELTNLAISECDVRCICVTARNGVNFNLIKPVTFCGSPRSQEICLGFLGVAFQNRGLELLLDTVQKLRVSGYDCTALIVGGGPLIPSLRKKARLLKLESHINFTGRVLPEKMAETVAKCDFMWAYYESWESHSLTGLSPLKIWTYLSLQKPVLARDPSQLMLAYREVPGINWLTGSDGATLATEIRKIVDLKPKNELFKEAENGRKYIIEHVSWDKHTKIISDAINHSLNCRSELAA